MRVYAIRHRISGQWLPDASHKSRGHRRGSSWTEPAPGVMPRLFKRPGDAHGFLTVWARGGQKAITERTGTWQGEDDHTVIKVTPMPHRKAEDFEVVALRLVEEPII